MTAAYCSMHWCTWYYVDCSLRNVRLSAIQQIRRRSFLCSIIFSTARSVYITRTSFGVFLVFEWAKLKIHGGDKLTTKSGAVSQVHAYFGFQPLTAYLSVNYLDRFLYSRRLPVISSPSIFTSKKKRKKRGPPYFLWTYLIVSENRHVVLCTNMHKHAFS